MDKPLLDLNLELENVININQYKKTLKEFVKLWGNDIHIFTNNLNETENLEEFLGLLESLDLATYSFIDGATVNKFYYIDDKIINLLIKKKVHSLGFVINEKIIQDERYINYVKKIVNEKINIETYYKIDKNNVKYIDKVLEFCLKSNIRLCIVDIDKQSKNRLYKEKYKEIVKKLLQVNEENKIKISIFECPYINILKTTNLNILGGCSAGMTSCMIDKDGYVVPCMYLKEIKIGNIREQNLSEIWNGEIFNKLRVRENISGKCSECKYIKVCGGCRAESFYKTGDLFKEDYNCWVEV